MLLPSLGTSIANVALPALAAAFEASFQQVQWVVLAYLLAITTLIVGVGRLGDIAGRRRLLLAGIAVFTASSIVGGAASSLWLLIAARAVQGIGAAILMALAIAFVAEIVPKHRTGRAMGLLGTMSATGTALGPSLGGILIDRLGWPAIFLVNVPLGLLAWFLARRYLPPDRRAAPAGWRAFDIAGTLLLAAALAAYALAMTTGHGSFGRLNVALLAAAVLGIALLGWTQARTPSPLIRIAMFRDRGLSAGFAMSALVSSVMMATLVVGPFYLLHGLAIDTARVGLVMSAGPLAAALTGVPAGRIVDRYGAQRMTLAGLAGMVGGSLALCAVPTAWGVAGYTVSIVVITANYALFQAANNTGVLRDVAADQRGTVSGMLNLSRNLGLVTGTSVLASVFAFAAGTVDFATAAPEAIAGGMRITFLVATASLVAALLIAAGTRRRMPGYPAGRSCAAAASAGRVAERA